MAPRETEDNAYAKFWGAKLMLGFQKKSILFARCIKELSIHVHSTRLAESMN